MLYSLYKKRINDSMSLLGGNKALLLLDRVSYSSAVISQEPKLGYQSHK